jgi:hypothetical protein
MYFINIIRNVQQKKFREKDLPRISKFCLKPKFYVKDREICLTLQFTPKNFT